jgi:hypothetical protein
MREWQCLFLFSNVFFFSKTDKSNACCTQSVLSKFF